MTTQPAQPPTLDDVMHELDGITHKLDKLHEEHHSDQYENLGWISCGFALTMVGIDVIRPTCINIGITVLLFVIGLILVVYFTKIKPKWNT